MTCRVEEGLHHCFFAILLTWDHSSFSLSHSIWKTQLFGNSPRHHQKDSITTSPPKDSPPTRWRWHTSLKIPWIFPALWNYKIDGPCPPAPREVNSSYTRVNLILTHHYSKDEKSVTAARSWTCCSPLEYTLCWHFSTFLWHQTVYSKLMRLWIQFLSKMWAIHLISFNSLQNSTFRAWNTYDWNFTRIRHITATTVCIQCTVP